MMTKDFVIRYIKQFIEYFKDKDLIAAGTLAAIIRHMDDNKVTPQEAFEIASKAINRRLKKYKDEEADESD